MARPYQALALAYENEGNLDQAYELYEKALTLDDPEPEQSRFNSLGNMGNILKKQKDYEGAMRLLTTAMELGKEPYASRVRFNLVLCLLNTGQKKEALKNIDVLLEGYPQNKRYLTSKGFVLLIKNDIDGALHYLRMALKNDPYDSNTLLNLGMAFGMSGAFERAEWFIKRAQSNTPRNIAIYLSLLQNAIVMRDEQRREQYLVDICRIYSIKQLQAFFTEHAQGSHYIGGMFVLVDDRIVLPALSEVIRKKAREL